MTKEEAINHLTDMYKYSGLVGLDREDRIALSKGIEALEHEPCEDAISRTAVLEWIKGSLEQYADTYSNDMLNMWKLFEEQINALPPIQPKVKVGKWITQWELKQQKEYYVCSECREEFSNDAETGIGMCEYNYCPNCGAKMEVEVEE